MILANNTKILPLCFSWLIYLFPLFYILGNFFVNASIFFVIIIGLIIFRSKIFDFKNEKSLFLIIAFFFLIFFFTFYENISNPGNVEVYKSIIFFRYLFLLLILRYAIINNFIKLEKFFISCLIFSTIISLDVLFQFITGNNIIGLKSTTEHRSSFFGNEHIAGGFIQRFSILGLFFLFFAFKKKYLNIIISAFFLIVSFFATLYSGNKMPMVMIGFFIIFMLFLLLIHLKVYTNKIFIFSFIAFLTVTFFQSEKLNNLYLNKIKNNYAFMHSQALGAIPNSLLGAMPNFKVIYSEVTRDYPELEKYKGKVWFHYTEEFKNKEKYKYIKTRSTYNNLYITSLDLFLEKPFLGRGIKSFRETCKERVHLPNRICSTHQHNYHLQILSDTGLIGYFTFFSAVILILVRCLRKKDFNSNIYLYATLIVIIIELFPLRSTGGFFSTSNSSFIFLIMGMIFGLVGTNKKVR